MLPDRSKTKWLEYDKSLYSDKWAALLAFLEDAYDKAVQEKLLLASYTPLTPIQKASAGSFAAKVEDETAGEKHAEDPFKKEQAKKRLEEARKRVGKCPLCQQEHTFKCRWRTEPWPLALARRQVHAV